MNIKCLSLLSIFSVLSAFSASHDLSSRSSTGAPVVIITAAELMQHQQAQNNDALNKALEHLSKTLNTLHSHIAALRRDRTGNPRVNIERLIYDYQTVSTLIRSIGTYQQPATNPLRALINYNAHIIHYKDETPLKKSIYKFIRPSIERAITELRSIGPWHTVFTHINKTMALLLQDLHDRQPSVRLRAETESFKEEALAKLRAQAPAISSNTPMSASRSSSNSYRIGPKGTSGKPNRLQPKQRRKRGRSKKRPNPAGCRTIPSYDKFIKKDDNDDDRRPNKRTRPILIK